MRDVVVGRRIVPAAHVGQAGVENRDRRRVQRAVVERLHVLRIAKVDEPLLVDRRHERKAVALEPRAHFLEVVRDVCSRHVVVVDVPLVPDRRIHQGVRARELHVGGEPVELEPGRGRRVLSHAEVVRHGGVLEADRERPAASGDRRGVADPRVWQLAGPDGIEPHLRNRGRFVVPGRHHHEGEVRLRRLAVGVGGPVEEALDDVRARVRMLDAGLVAVVEGIAAGSRPRVLDADVGRARDVVGEGDLEDPERDL